MPRIKEDNYRGFYLWWYLNELENNVPRIVERTKKTILLEHSDKSLSLLIHNGRGKDWRLSEGHRTDCATATGMYD